MNILLVFATKSEAGVIGAITGSGSFSPQIQSGKLSISVLITGVGGISTAWALQKWISGNPKPDLAINAGISGSFSKKYKPGDVVMPVSDCFADLGIEKESGYQTIMEAGFIGPDDFPFSGGIITSANQYVKLVSSLVPPVKAITVNTASGSPDTIKRLRQKFDPDIETMEGATFFYICARENIPFLAIRAVSNMVVPRGDSAWQIPLALENLAGKMNEILKIL